MEVMEGTEVEVMEAMEVIGVMEVTEVTEVIGVMEGTEVVQGGVGEYPYIMTISVYIPTNTIYANTLLPQQSSMRKIKTRVE